MNTIPPWTAVRWGVVGTGEVSRSFAADLTEATGSRRLAVASRDQQRANQFAGDCGFERAYSDLEGILADPDIDIVYIGTPHGTHRDIAIQTLRAGKHVLIEKPMAVDRAQAEEIRSVAAQVGRFAMEAMWMKFSLLFRQLLADIEAGTVGEPRSVRASFGVPFPRDTGSRWSAELGGSTLLDQGIYPITLAMALFGTPTEIIARGQMRPDGVDLAEHITLEFADGRYAQLAASMIDFCELTATVNGTLGWINVPVPFWSGSRYRTYAGPDKDAFQRGIETEIPFVGNGFTPMIEHVNAALSTGLTQSSIHPLTDSLAVFHVMDEVRSQLLARSQPTA
jgi:predicted dehydrogenase